MSDNEFLLLMITWVAVISVLLASVVYVFVAARHFFERRIKEKMILSKVANLKEVKQYSNVKTVKHFQHETIEVS